MKTTNSRKTQPTWNTHVQAGGTIWLPASFPTGWRLGQRLYFCVQHGAALITTTPKRLLHGRLCSTRVRRARPVASVLAGPGRRERRLLKARHSRRQHARFRR